jgi:hypothetical protein
MPEASTPPKLPKYIPDMQGENRERTSIAEWYQNEFLPWIQNQDLKNLVGMLLLGALTGLAGLFIIIMNIFLFLIICIEEFILNLSNLNLGSMQFEPESGDM